MSNRLKLKETRREFLVRSAQGMGSLALASLLNGNGLIGRDSGPLKTDEWGGVVNPLHHLPRAKRIIYLYMAGGPSHLETFDYKPELQKRHGGSMPESLTKGQQMSTMTSGQRLKVMSPLYPFEKFGKSGQEICTLFPYTGQIADDICIIRSMQTEQINHDPAHTFMNTGSIITGRPSLGSWMVYGLGSECDNLPGFVVMTSIGGGGNQPIAARQWHSGFLPGRFQGVQFQSKGDPVNYVASPDGVSLEDQKKLIDTVNALNRMKDRVVDDPEISTRISQYEMAFRMQTSVPELVDFSGEPQYIKDLYGTEGADGSFAANCLLARRMAERGVRFIQLYHRGWDHHGGLKKNMKTISGLVDRASAALVLDLKQRGMLEDTLVIWGGEFGRTPMAQPSGKEGNEGRDHHIKCFSIWMAGAGVKAGISYGQTDDFGYDVAQDRVHVHDLHATILHIMGIDHKQLTYRFQGRDFRLTDVHGNIVRQILA
ncbi:MAG: DUF1501 domain-containing protein [Acidobacteriota bacterium]